MRSNTDTSNFLYCMPPIQSLSMLQTNSALDNLSRPCACVKLTHTHMYPLHTLFHYCQLKNMLPTTSVASKGPELYFPFVTSFGEV